MHPYLGATPNGEVLEKCLVEVKRIFPGTMTLDEAVCSEGFTRKLAVVLLSIKTMHTIIPSAATVTCILFSL